MRIRTNVEGFSLVEFMIAVAVLAILAALALPSLLASRIAANEAAAISTLNSIYTAQKTLREANLLDSNNNGVGEYGYFQELSGQRRHRLDANGNGYADSVATSKIAPPVLPDSFRADDSGLVMMSGYYFRMYLPGFMNFFRPELSPTQRFNFVSARSAENHWACMAWPTNKGSTGNRIFFVNETGTVLGASNHVTNYGGPLNPPHIAGVLPLGSTGHDMMSSSLAVNATGKDDNYWMAVE